MSPWLSGGGKVQEGERRGEGPDARKSSIWGPGKGCCAWGGGGGGEWWEMNEAHRDLSPAGEDFGFDSDSE